MTIALAIVLLILLALLTLSSYVERIFAEKGRFLSREFQENIEVYDQIIEVRLGGAASRMELTMSVLAQLSTAGFAIASLYLVMADGRWAAGEIGQAIVALILVVIVFNRLLPFVFFTRTKG